MKKMFNKKTTLIISVLVLVALSTLFLLFNNKDEESLLLNKCPLGGGSNFKDEVVYSVDDIVYTKDTCEVSVDVDGDRDIKLIAKLSTINNEEVTNIYLNDSALEDGNILLGTGKNIGIGNVHQLKDAIFFILSIDDTIGVDIVYGVTAETIIFSSDSTVAQDGGYFYLPGTLESLVTNGSLNLIDGDKLQYNLSTTIKETVTNTEAGKILIGNDKEVDLCSAPSNSVLYAQYSRTYLGNREFSEPVINNFVTINDVKTKPNVDGSYKEIFDLCK